MSGNRINSIAERNTGEMSGTDPNEACERPVANPRPLFSNELVSPCRLCPHKCGVDRIAGERGICSAGMVVVVSSVGKHFGEEPPISGTRGSGTIFFTLCNLSCVFCQNYQISQPRKGETGRPYTSEKLAEQMLALEEAGAHNINLVSPTQWTLQVANAIIMARNSGLTIPVVWNSNGYELVETVRLLDGLVEIYMPDFKYGLSAPAVRFSNAPDYPDRAIEAIREMYRQVGELVVDDSGVAKRGLLVRHLVLPNDLSGTRFVLCALASEVSPKVSVSLMSQYYPTHRAKDFPDLVRPLHKAEYMDAMHALQEFGLTRGWTQDYREAPLRFRPDFDEEEPFEEWTGV